MREGDGKEKGEGREGEERKREQRGTCLLHFVWGIDTPAA